METHVIERLQLRTILCLVDFSDGSRQALAAAAALARHFESNLWVLHVAEAAAKTGRVLPPWVTATIDERERERVLARLRSFVSHVPTGHPAVSVAVRHGDPVREALRYARTLGTDLIVAGATRDARPTRRLSPTLPERLGALASIPLLIVPDDAAAPDAGTRWLSHVVCAVDLSAASRAALSFALRLVLETEASLTVLHVHDPSRAVDESSRPVERIRLDAQRLRMLVPAGVDRFCDIHYLVLDGSPAEEIAAMAARTAVDLIVVGNEARRPGAGSIAGDLVQRCPRPVLVASGAPRLHVPWPDWTGASEPLGAA